MRRSLLVVLLISLVALAACIVSRPSGPPTATATMPPTVAIATTAAPTSTLTPANTVTPGYTPPATDTVAPTDTPAPSDTPAPTNTTAPTPTTGASATTPHGTATTAPTSTAAPTAGPGPTGAPSTYLDDRSTAAALMQSFVNALNRHQYVRAYYYWTPGAPQLQPFAQFQAGYANTQSTQLTLGTITSSGAAGHVYFNTPVSLVAQTTGGSQTFVGCYILNWVQPGTQGAPPFQPLSIDQAHVQQVANGTNIAPLLAQACQNFPGLPLPVTPAPDPNDITPARYRDDRTDAIQVLRSLFNAVNRKEYVRAYSYWETNAQGLPPFNQFQQGYANTAAVTLAFGTVTSDAGAGQFYNKVPVTLVAATTSGATQTFVACYILHLASPDAQGAPPYQPLGARSATVKLVANNANTASLMAQACQ